MLSFWKFCVVFLEGVLSRGQGCPFLLPGGGMIDPVSLSTARTNFRRHRADRTSNVTVKVNIHKRRLDRFLNRPPLHYEPSGTRHSDTEPFIYASGPVLRGPITRYRLS